MEVGDEKMNARQMMLCMAGSVMCSVGVMGCYPLVPAYFCGAVSGAGQRAGAARYDVHRNVCVYADGGSSKVCGGACRGDGTIRLVEWANEGCPSYMAGSMAAIITMILSVAGGFLNGRISPEFWRRRWRARLYWEP